MIWLPGKIVRFKSDIADNECRELAERLHGRCKKTAPRELTITKPVRWILDAAPRDQTPSLERDDIIECGTNGRQEAAAAAR